MPEVPSEAIGNSRSPQGAGNKMLMWSFLALGIIYMIKAFTNALFLTLRNSGRFHLSSKSIATVDVHGCVDTKPEVYLILLRYTDGCGIHIGVGFCVARSDDNGRCQKPRSVGRVMV